jgi:hypothetical protein
LALENSAKTIGCEGGPIGTFGNGRKAPGGTVKGMEREGGKGKATDRPVGNGIAKDWEIGDRER